MALTNWSISEETLITISHFYAPFYLFNMALSHIVNLLIIIATIRSSKLKNICNILIAIQAAADIVITWEVPVYVYHVYMHQFITIHDCFLAQTVPWVAMNFTTCLMLLIGLDRYLCVKHTTWYMMLNKIYYFALMMGGCISYCVLVMVGIYLTTTDQKVLCFLADAMAGHGKNAWAGSQAIINVVVVIVYGKLKKFLESRTTRAAGDRDTRKIFRSLYLIVLFYIFGWVTTIILLLSVRVLIADPYLEQAGGQFLGAFAATNLTIPFFVYFTQSAVYRKEILGIFIPYLEQAGGQFLGAFAATNLTIPFFVYFTQSAVYRKEILAIFMSEHRVAKISPGGDSSTMGGKISTIKTPYAAEHSVVA
uniref:G_PROTEIN_RECEP_F1_2 domain-containing protein n=1 Tax=Steinernema glaseri TaxID=37863 RepID=A0A1I7Y020_9BILA